MADTAPNAQTETTEAPVTAPVPDQPAAPPSLKDRLVAELGFENVADDSEATERLVAAYRDERQRNAEFEQKLEAALARLTPQQAPQPETPKTKPQLDKRLVAQYRTPEGWKDGTPENVRQQYDEWERQRTAFAEALLDDPDGALELERKFEAYFEKKFGQVSQQQREQQVMQQTLTENADWLFEKHAITGQPRMDTLTAEGQLFNQFFVEAQDLGFERAWKYATAMHKAAKAEATAKQTGAAQAAIELNEQKKRESLQRAGAGLNRSGSLPAPEANRQAQKNRHVRFGQLVAQAAARDGVSLD